MKTVGILGGLGPETTAIFYLEIIKVCFKHNKKARPSILIWNVPIPFKVEEDLIIRGEGADRFLPFLIDGAKRLEKGGADFLVIPCNSVHIFIEDIRKAVHIPVLSIIEEAVKEIKKQKKREIGILSTTATLNKQLFQKALANESLSCRIPTNTQQLELSKVIHKIVIDRHTNKDVQKIKLLIASLKARGIKLLILACTDLQLVVKREKGLLVLDTMKSLVKATVRELLVNT